MALLLANGAARRLALGTVLLQKLHGQVERIPVPGATPLHLVLDDLVGVEELLPLRRLQMGYGARQGRARTRSRSGSLSSSRGRLVLAVASTATATSAGASSVRANWLVDALGAYHAHIDSGDYGLLQITGILRRQLVAARRLLLLLLVAARPRLLRVGNGVLLLMGVFLAAAQSASGTHRATSCAAATATGPHNTTASTHPRSGVVVETLAHFSVPVVASTDAQLGEEPDAATVQEIAAEVDKEGEDYSAGRHNDRLARLGPVHHRIDGGLIFPANDQKLILGKF